MDPNTYPLRAALIIMRLKEGALPPEPEFTQFNLAYLQDFPIGNDRSNRGCKRKKEY